MAVIEEFVANVFFEIGARCRLVDNARYSVAGVIYSGYTIFSSSTSGGFRELPPSNDGLELHILRSAFQAGWVWGNTLSQKATPSNDEWG